MLWTPIALGADRGIYINTTFRHDTALQPLIVAQALKHIVLREKIDLVLLGKQCTPTSKKRLTTTATRQDNCWRDYSTGRKPPSPPR